MSRTALTEFSSVDKWFFVTVELTGEVYTVGLHSSLGYADGSVQFKNIFPGVDYWLCRIVSEKSQSFEPIVDYRPYMRGARRGPARICTLMR